MPRWIWNRSLCLSAILFAAAARGPAGQPARALHVQFSGGVFRLEGWDGGSAPPAAGWPSIFPVYAGNSRTPMLGTYSVEDYSVEDHALVFRPRFPPVEGIAYRGTFPGGRFQFEPRPARAPSARVERVYPSSGVLPANTLRLYVCFSAPMSAGEAFRHIRLLQDGHVVPNAFLDQELWDPERKRLTILFDPGRIKRGLAPAREAGAPIVPGKSYTLEIDPGWRDAQGIPLAQGFRKTFVGAPAERTPPETARWRITAPRAGSRQPLTVTFPRPMDFALLQQMLGVAGVPGAIATGANETEWRFTPDAPWRAGRYVLNAASALEDISGNRLDRPFDVDLHATPAPAAARGTISIPFTVRP